MRKLASMVVSPASQACVAYSRLEIKLAGLHWGLQHLSTETDAEIVLFNPPAELLAALHAATAEACRDGDCPCTDAHGSCREDCSCYERGLEAARQVTP